MKVSTLTRAIRLVGLVWIALAVAEITACLYIDHTLEQSHKAHKPSDFVKKGDLQKWYEGFNEEYFLDQLPKNTIVKWDDLSAQQDMGMVFSEGDHWKILIDVNTNPVQRQALLTELHEMCHMAARKRDARTQV